MPTAISEIAESIYFHRNNCIMVFICALKHITDEEIVILFFEPIHISTKAIRIVSTAIGDSIILCYAYILE